MKTAATNKRIRELITAVQKKTLLPRPEFQRRLVWSNKDKLNFLDTVLRGYPFPEIYLADGEVDLDTGEGTQLLVDGQQRINTLYEYFTGSDNINLGNGIQPYRQLSEHDKSEFLGYLVVVRDLGSITEQEVVEVFRRINQTSYSLNEMEISNAVYRGPFKNFAENLSDLDFFERRRFFRPLQLRRMGDVKYILTILVTMMDGYFNRDSDLEEFLNRYNEAFPLKHELRERFMSVLNLIDELKFDGRSRAWKQADFFTLFCELDRAIFIEKSRPNVTKLHQSLEEFYGEVDNSEDTSREIVKEYYGAVIQGANDRGNRVRRGNAIRYFVDQASRPT